MTRLTRALCLALVLVAGCACHSVAESIQASTAQLADWIKKDYRLSDSEVALFLGAVMR